MPLFFFVFCWCLHNGGCVGWIVWCFRKKRGVCVCVWGGGGWGYKLIWRSLFYRTGIMKRYSWTLNHNYIRVILPYSEKNAQQWTVDFCSCKSHCEWNWPRVSVVRLFVKKLQLSCCKLERLERKRNIHICYLVVGGACIKGGVWVCARVRAWWSGAGWWG